MTTFYFNEVLPAASDTNVNAVFETTVRRASDLIRRLHLTKPIVTSVASCDLRICGLTLVELISRCQNRDVKTRAYDLFSHNVVSQYESQLSDADTEALLEADYKFEGSDATNLAIAHRMEWPLLSLALSEALQHDYLTVESVVAEALQVANYYAQDDTGFIERWVAERTAAGLEGLERFRALFSDRLVITEPFRKGWDDATPDLQTLAIEKFRHALQHDMLFPVRADDKLIRKCDDRGCTMVYELRQIGQGLRVYFGYTANCDKIIMAGLHTKAQSKDDLQTADIQRAERQIKLILAVEEKKSIHLIG